MKKLIVILSLLLFAVTMNAQVSGSTVTMAANSTYAVITPTATDTVSGTVSKYWDIALNKSKLQYFGFAVSIDSTKRPSRIHGNRVLVQVYGAVQQTGTWRQIGTNIFYGVNAGTSGDTTMLVADLTTGILYRYLRIKFTGVVANHCATVSKLSLRVADK